MKARGVGEWGRRGAVLAAALCALGWMPPPAMGRAFEASGKVVHVDDGDTVVVLLPGNLQTRVRLSSIDAPESSHERRTPGRVGQPYSNNSRQGLASMVKGREVGMRCFEEDRHGRQVCELFVGGESVNRAMVAAGLAWANTASRGRFMRDPALLQLQEQARREGRGLWQQRNPVPPWEWRTRCWENNDCRPGD